MFDFVVARRSVFNWTLCVLILLSVSTFAWSGHEVYTFFVVKALRSERIDLDKLIPVTRYSYRESRLYNSRYYFVDDFAGERKFFDPLGDGETPPDPKPTEGKLPAWQILTIYAQFPDFGMDEGLELSPLQALIGNSQGVRHMRYKLGPIEAFEGHASFLYFAEMSLTAFRGGDEYWGYRFLSYALHYLQDLFQPYHASPGTFFEVLQSIFDKKARAVLNNAHMTYDNYLIYLLLYSNRKEDVREIIEKTPALRVPTDWSQLVNEVMMYAYASFPAIHNEVKKAFGDIIREKVPSIEDFRFLEESGTLDSLYRRTVDIVRVMTAVHKGFIINFLASAGIGKE